MGASATLAAFTSSRLTVMWAVVSSKLVSSVALAGLPAASVTLASTVRLPSASPLRSALVR
ncbi:hypothetical protein D3C72_2271620 [compost metagenome]